MARAHIAFLIPCCLLLSTSVRSLDPAVPITQYVHEVWQSKEGLPQNSINDIIQTQDGYLWMASYDGLIRFDGVRFKIFDSGNTPGMTSNRITMLQEGKDGSLLIATESNGLIQMKNSVFQSYSSADGFAVQDRDIKRIKDKDGNLWIGTPRNGLLRRRDGNYESFSAKDGLSNDWITKIYEDREGNLWVCTDEGGLNRFKNGNCIALTKREGLPHNYISSIYEDIKRNIWIGTKGGWAYLMNGKLEIFKKENDSANIFVNAIAEDSERNLWFGTNGGLYHSKNGKITNYSIANGLSSNSILAIHEDGAGYLWIGTWGGGLVRMVAQRHSATGDQRDSATVERNDKATARQKDNAAEGGGRGAKGEGPGEEVSGKRKVECDYKFTNFTTKNGLVNDIIRCIHEDRNGNLWLGTDGGVTRMQKSELRIKNAEKKGWESGSSAFSLQPSAYSFTNYTMADGLSDNHVRVIHEDAEGVLWIGTYGGGLNRFKDGRFTQIKPKDGLFDKVVSWILEDDHGNFWMTCNRGIYRAKRKDLNDFCDGKRSSIECISYDESDGMASAECNGGSSPAGWKARDGKLWFPTFKGVVCVDPNNLPHNPLPPPVVVEEVTIDGKTADFKSSPRLAHGKGDLEVKYTALSFVNPKKVKFKYRLDGYDTDWVNAGTRRTAYYTNLPIGHLKFRVIACNNDGVWNREGASFEFYFKPHLYQTPWAFGFYFLSLGAGVWGFIRYRTRRLRKKAEMLLERTEMAREIHDTLAQRFAGVVMQLEAMRDRCADVPPEGREILGGALASARQSLEETRRSVMILRRTGEMEKDFSQVLSALMRRMAEGFPPALEMDIPASLPPISSVVSLHTLRIAQEALTNILKHAQASHAWITVSTTGGRMADSRWQMVDGGGMTEDEKRETHKGLWPSAYRLLGRRRGAILLLTIRDDGIGFDVDSAKGLQGHYGLIGMRERAQAIGAELTIESAPGQGTTVRVGIPIR